MRKLLYLLLIVALMVGVSGCKPSPHPKHPDYKIKKPRVKYKKANKKNLSKMVKKLQGRPYVWAEEGPSYFDCSGFTYYMYGSMGIDIPRVARKQAKCGVKIAVADLRYGDLIFFDTDKRRRGKITHVGMYLKDGWFTHASTTNYEIEYSNLNTSKYYKERLRMCRRYLPQKTSIKLAKNSNNKIKPWSVKKSTNILNMDKKAQAELIKRMYDKNLL